MTTDNIQSNVFVDLMCLPTAFPSGGIGLVQPDERQRADAGAVARSEGRPRPEGQHDQEGHRGLRLGHVAAHQLVLLRHHS